MDNIVQPCQHGHAKDRGEADPSQLQDHKVRLSRNGIRVQKAPRTAMCHGIWCFRAK